MQVGNDRVLIGGGHRLEEVELLVADRVLVVAAGRLHRDQRQHLQQVVLDDVAQSADGVVETAAVLDAEVLGHRHLHVGDVLAVPDRLEDRVGEAQVGDVHHRLLAEEVVDAQDLVLLENLMQLGVELSGRLQVVAEGLLDNDPRVLGRSGLAEPADDGCEQRRRDLEVEHRVLVVLDLRCDPLERVGLVVLAADVGQALRQPLEHRLVDVDPGVTQGRTDVLDQARVVPVVAGDADDAGVEALAGLQPVQRAEGHLLGEVSGDPEDHQDVGLLAGRHARRLSTGCALS